MFLFALHPGVTRPEASGAGGAELSGDDLRQAARAERLQSAFLGGVIFNLSNILLVAAIDIAGMAVAFPIGVGLALVLGVITNYMATPLGNATLLFLRRRRRRARHPVLGCRVSPVCRSRGRRRPGKGMALSVVAGLLMGYFYRFVAASMSTDFGRLEAGKLGPYTAIVVFSLGLLLSNVPLEHDRDGQSPSSARRCPSATISAKGRCACTWSGFWAG